ncbi:MAG: hypothetical protein ACI837_001635 [Crocinitomicaceae bacterium]|jgi:hypothetical protein
MNSTQYLIEFANKLEEKNIVNNESGIKIRNFIRGMESSTSWELFMIIGGIMGALFCSAGIFALISHNWDDFPKHTRGFFSVVPALAGLYFYYRALFHHEKSKTWIEASSLFLMLMIGASIALVSQTYQMDGDFTKFIKVWMLLTIPLFYFAKASGLAIFYLGLILILVIDYSIGAWGIPSIERSENMNWYWLMLLAFLPHYYMSLNKNGGQQSIRVIYLSYCLYFTVILALGFTVQGNYLLWFLFVQVGFYLLGKKYMSSNDSFPTQRGIMARPFQFGSQLWISFALLAISNKDALHEVFRYDSFFNYDKWDTDQTFYFYLLIVLMAGLYTLFFIFRKHFGNVNYAIIFAPIVVIYAMFLNEYLTSWWWLTLLLNFYILFLGFMAIFQGSSNNYVTQMAAGLILISVLLWIRYFDSDLNFIVKGLIFMGVGGAFFLINLLVREKVEEIEEVKK